MVAAVLIGLGGAASPAARAVDLDASRLTWSELVFRAKKFGISAGSDVAIEMVPASRLDSVLMAAQEGTAVPPGPDGAVLVSLGSSIIGRTTRSMLWFDPVSAVALQRDQLDTASKAKRNRHKIIRFAREGQFSETRRPEESEVGTASTGWSQISYKLDRYPDEVDPKAPISEPAALFYIATTGDFSRLGNSYQVQMLGGRQFFTVTVTAKERVQLDVAYNETSRKGMRQAQGKVDAIRLSIHGAPVGGERDADFKFIGLHGDISLFIDPVKRLPLEVSGKLSAFGTVRIRLREATLD